MPGSMSPESSGFLDGLFDLLRQAFDDVRHKVVEDGWFGRQVTGELEAPQTTIWDGPPAKSFEEQWAVREPGKAEPAHDQDLPGMER